ncbi:MAG: hypothetical protein ACYTGH_08575 [Planctomycetota bacterium]|jgi:hypothetical protein
MRIPRYWAKGGYPEGEADSFWAWGWSFTNLEEAKATALERAKRFFEAFHRNERLDAYEYPDSPLREEIVESVGPEGEESILITRNRYGALILNCREICFVDVDITPPPSLGFIDSILLLFSAEKREARKKAGEDEVLNRIRDWHRKNTGTALRIYRTAAGFRLLFTDRTYEATGSETQSLFEALGSDPLYQRLTQKQECFRARLTPKPWRCGFHAPPNRYPWTDEGAEQAYRAWVQTYEERSRGYTVCRLVERLGSEELNEPMASVVALHDEYTGAQTHAPLA